jgi:esterase/lipase superfamily enzyme
MKTETGKLNEFDATGKVKSLAEISISGEQLAFTAAELDIDLARLKIAANAAALMEQKERQVSHELLYGLAWKAARRSRSALPFPP